MLHQPILSKTYQAPPASVTRQQPLPANQPVQQPTTTVPVAPQFASLSSMIGMLENRFLELFVTDVVGMGITRTGIEYVKRGPDAARENAIRDATGTFFNLFAAGIFTHFMIKFLANHVKALNPKWVNQKAWITAPLLNEGAFGQRYLDALAEAKDPAEARKRFIRSVLGDIQNSNRDMGKTAFNKAFEGSGRHLNDFKTTGAYQGRLSEPAIKELSEALAHIGNTVDPNKPIGTHNFEKMVEERLKNTTDGKPVDAAKKRMQLSLQRHGKVEKEIIENLVDIAKRGGLADTVDIGTAKGENLKVVLQGLRNTLHEVVDRGTEGLKGDPEWKEKAAARTFDNIENKAKGLLPKAEDGLINYIAKSKRLYLYLPIMLTIGAGISMAFLNNWLTKRKNGGKAYFPGEGKSSAGQQVPTVSAGNGRTTAHSLPLLDPSQAQDFPINPAATQLRRAQLFNALEQQIRQQQGGLNA